MEFSAQHGIEVGFPQQSVLNRHLALAALAKAFPVASDAVDRCVCAFALTAELVDAAEYALSEAERLDGIAGDSVASGCVRTDRAIFELRLNGASPAEIYDYINRVVHL